MVEELVLFDVVVSDPGVVFWVCGVERRTGLMSVTTFVVGTEIMFQHGVLWCGLLGPCTVCVPW